VILYAVWRLNETLREVHVDLAAKLSRLLERSEQ
jgi:hypothetical protein